MNGNQLIELTKEHIYNATHFNVPYVEQIYSDKLLIVKIDENAVVYLAPLFADT